MSDDPIQLDERRGMTAQKATVSRRRQSEVEETQVALKRRSVELEADWASAPAADWPDAVQKARYLLGLLASTGAGQDPRRQRLIARVLSDFDMLIALPADEPGE